MDTKRNDTNGNQLSKRRRKNVSRACTECRRRRAKCDANTPSCSRCITRSVECIYSTEEDKRRPAPKSYVDLLRARIDHLELLLHAHSIDPNSSPDSEVASPSNLRLPFTPSLQNSATGTLKHQDYTLTLQGELSKNESMNFDQDGEARYFGPTSGRLEFKALSQDKPDGGAVTTSLNRLCQGLLDEDPISQELQDHLIDLFFIWEQPFNQAVDEHMFRNSLESNGKWCNPLLLNCILCVGSRHSDRAEVRTDPEDPNTAGRMFLDKAELLLHFELKSPRLTTIQSAMILTTAYCSFGEDAASWLHHGIAIRLAVDMGINLDFGANRQPDAADANPPAEEVLLRRQIHWTLYSMDKLAAMYTGRTCTYLDFQSSVDLPQSDLHPPDLHFGDERYTQNTELLCAQVSLCQIVETIILSLYAPKPIISREQRGGFWSSCHVRLNNWRYDLPDRLLLERYTASLPPAVFTLHMIYHTAHIQLTKPFLTKSRTEPAHNQGPTIATARQKSYQAALGVCQVAAKYRATFGSFRRSAITATHCTLSAALIFINALASRWEGIDLCNTQRHIDLCLFVLSELSVSWNPAGRMRKSVHSLCQHIKKQNATSCPSDKDAPAEGALIENLDASLEKHEAASVAVPSRDEGQVIEYGLSDMDDYVADPFAEIYFQGHSSIDAFSNVLEDSDPSWGLLPDDYGLFGILNREHFQNSW